MTSVTLCLEEVCAELRLLGSEPPQVLALAQGRLGDLGCQGRDPGASSGVYGGWGGKNRANSHRTSTSQARQEPQGPGASTGRQRFGQHSRSTQSGPRATQSSGDTLFWFCLELSTGCACCVDTALQGKCSTWKALLKETGVGRGGGGGQKGEEKHWPRASTGTCCQFSECQGRASRAWGDGWAAGEQHRGEEPSREVGRPRKGSWVQTPEQEEEAVG